MPLQAPAVRFTMQFESQQIAELQDQLLTLLMLAVGVRFTVCGSSSLDMQCGASWREHWLLSVHVSTWLLHLPA